MEDEQIGVSPRALYEELKALRLQSQTLCDRLDRVLTVLEPVLCGALGASDSDTASEEEAQQQLQSSSPPAPLTAGATYVGEAAYQSSPPRPIVCDVDQTLRSHITLALQQAHRALTNTEVITALHGNIEQRYEKLSKKQVNTVLHTMLREGALFCATSGKYNYWTLASEDDALLQQRS